MKGGRLSGEERREQIMEAALDLFAQKGFRGTRTREIAARVGISETLIFQHFPTKEDLYRAVIDRSFGVHPVRAEVEGQIEAGDDWGFLYHLAMHVVKHLGRDTRLIRLWLYRVLEEPGFSVADSPWHGAVIPERRDRLFDTICNYLQKRIEAGAFRKTDVRIAGKLFLEALIMHLVNRELKILDALPHLGDEEAVLNLIDIFLSGLKE